MRYFISGHRDITINEFRIRYGKPITDAVLKEPNTVEFVVGDYYGVDAMAQDCLAKLKKNYPNVKVTVYHMFDSPRNNINQFPTAGSYVDDHDRDSAMTMATDSDIAWVRPGKQNSGTEQNLIRRKVQKMLNLCDKDDATNLLKSIIKLADYEIKNKK